MISALLRRVLLNFWLGFGWIWPSVLWIKPVAAKNHIERAVIMRIKTRDDALATSDGT